MSEHHALHLPQLGKALKAIWEEPAVNLSQLGVALALGTTVVVAARVFYNIYLHPLHKYPGPILARATSLWRLSKILSGDLPQTVKELHDEYGPVVRIAPFELSFIESQAWKDIYGHHGSYEMHKDDKMYRPMGKNVADTILTAERAHHSMLRRQMAHGFSERALRDQEPVFRHYVDLLMQRLGELAGEGKPPVDMKSWLNYTTFDVIGNLAFGSDFDCLEKSYSHPWVQAVTSNLKDTAIMRVANQIIPTSCVYLLNKSGVFKGRKAHVGYSKDKLLARMEMEVERPDFMEGLLKKRDEIPREELELNASIIVLAGSETTATLLSGAFFLLGTHRDVLDKLIQEVRTTFSSEDEIDLISVNGLNYMLACLKESFRQYPPVPVGLPRVVPKGGCNVAGHWVPQDTSVSVWQLASNMSARNFAKPEEFRPERWLGDPEFANDDQSAMQPFSIGPRNCIGRNLAYAEMRLIMAKILYKFDVELAPEGRGWLEGQKVYTLWDKPTLPFYLKPAADTA